MYAHTLRKRMSEHRQESEKAVLFTADQKAWSGLFKKKFLRLDLSRSDSDNHFKNRVNMALKLGSLSTFLAKMKKVVKSNKTHDLAKTAKIVTKVVLMRKFFPLKIQYSLLSVCHVRYA